MTWSKLGLSIIILGCTVLINVDFRHLHGLTSYCVTDFQLVANVGLKVYHVYRHPYLCVYASLYIW